MHIFKKKIDQKEFSSCGLMNRTLQDATYYN